MQNEDLIKLLVQVLHKITDDSDMVWASYDSAKALREELLRYIKELSEGNLQSIEIIHQHFSPTSTFQEHSLSNGWADDYLSISTKFDLIYQSIKR